MIKYCKIVLYQRMRGILFEAVLSGKVSLRTDI